MNDPFGQVAQRQQWNEERYERDKERRAQMDMETVRGLGVLNGGLAAGLVAMLPRLMSMPWRTLFVCTAVVGAACGVAGLYLAIKHNVFRRDCNNLHWDPDADPHGPEPDVCITSRQFRDWSLRAFVIGAGLVAAGFIVGAIAAPPITEPGVAPVPVKPKPQHALSLGSPQADDASKAAYDADERCGRTAREWFRGSRLQFVLVNGKYVPKSDYESHFSARKNACFALVSDQPTEGTGPPTLREKLFDVNTNHLVGQFEGRALDAAVVNACIVGMTSCKSLAEWTLLTDEYMQK